MSNLPPRFQFSSQEPISWDSLEILWGNYLESEASDRLTQVPRLLEATSPWIRSAVGEVAARHSYLVDVGALQPLMQRQILEQQQVPGTELAFRIRLESVCIRTLHKERDSKMSPIVGPTPAWHGFRRRFNALDSLQRRKVLGVLPVCSWSSSVDVDRQLPDQEWAELWAPLSEGVPESTLPAEWQRFFADPSACTNESADAIDADAQPVSAFEVPNIILAREAKARSLGPLGTWLFRAAAMQEDGRIYTGQKRLFLPNWVLPQSGLVFASELDAITKYMGGMPGDKNLQSMLLGMQDSLKHEGKLPLDAQTMEILSMAKGWGGRPVLLEGLTGISHLRSSSLESARLAYERLLNSAASKNDVALALANIAGLDLLPARYEEAGALLREALRLNPWSTVARQGLQLLTQLMKSHNNLRGSNEG